MWCCEIPPGVLCTVLVPLTSEGHGTVETSPEEAHKVVKRAEAPSLWRQAEEVEAVQPRQEKVEWIPNSNIPVPEGSLQGAQRGIPCQEI